MATKIPKGVTPKQITMSLGKTVNLGNYESGRVDVGMTVEVEDADLDATFAYLSKILTEKLKKELGD